MFILQLVGEWLQRGIQSLRSPVVCLDFAFQSKSLTFHHSSKSHCGWRSHYDEWQNITLTSTMTVAFREAAQSHDCPFSFLTDDGSQLFFRLKQTSRNEWGKTRISALSSSPTHTELSHQTRNHKHWSRFLLHLLSFGTLIWLLVSTASLPEQPVHFFNSSLTNGLALMWLLP